MPISNVQIAILLSGLVAFFLIWRLWRSNDHPFFKSALSFIALIPFFGPVIVLWLSNFPSKLPPALRDQRRYSTDVTDRWRDTLNEKNPIIRFGKWKKIMKETEHDPD
jgi:hypothetical protein